MQAITYHTFEYSLYSLYFHLLQTAGSQPSESNQSGPALHRLLSNKSHDTAGSGSSRDFSHISPRIPGVFERLDSTEYIRLQNEVKELKLKYAEDTQHFQNQIAALQHHKEIAAVERHKSKVSILVDQEIADRVDQQRQKQIDAAVRELEHRLESTQNQHSSEMEQLRRSHTEQLGEQRRKFEVRLESTAQIHAMELRKNKDDAQRERERLNGKVRELQSKLERQSRSEREVQVLEEEIEALKTTKQKLIEQYEQTIARLNDTNDKLVKKEVEKRVQMDKRLRRELKELEGQQRRDQRKCMELSAEVERLRKESGDKDLLHTQLREMVVREQRKVARLNRKMTKNGITSTGRYCVKC